MIFIPTWLKESDLDSRERLGKEYACETHNRVQAQLHWVSALSLSLNRTCFMSLVHFLFFERKYELTKFQKVLVDSFNLVHYHLFRHGGAGETVELPKAEFSSGPSEVTISGDSHPLKDSMTWVLSL